nr:hypothetical protein [Cupriavidus sp. DB3]
MSTATAPVAACSDRLSAIVAAGESTPTIVPSTASGKARRIALAQRASVSKREPSAATASATITLPGGSAGSSPPATPKLITPA